MRGCISEQLPVSQTVVTAQMIDVDHSLRSIKKFVDTELARMSRQFSEAYNMKRHPSEPAECLLQTLYSIRSERAPVEHTRFDLRFRWFLDMSPKDPALDTSAFSRNRQRMADFGMKRTFFNGVVGEAFLPELASHDHLTVDGTLMAALKSTKSPQSIEGAGTDERGDDEWEPRGGRRNGDVNFRGERLFGCHAHPATDPETTLSSTGLGNRAMPGYSG